MQASPRDDSAVQRVNQADRLAWCGVAAGLIVSGFITAGMLGGRLGGAAWDAKAFAASY